MFKESGILFSKDELKRACQTFVKFDKQRLRDVWRVNAYRAQLQVLVQQHASAALDEHGKLNMGPLIKTAYCDWPSYVAGALTKLASSGLERDAALAVSQCAQLVTEAQLQQLECRISLLALIRMAVCIETPLILDRLLALEQTAGIEASALNLFEMEDSPRNIVVVAIKNSV
eukprot:jgi/Hompol1/1766/HPOL_005712-RA